MLCPCFSVSWLLDEHSGAGPVVSTWMLIDWRPSPSFAGGWLASWPLIPTSKQLRRMAFMVPAHTWRPEYNQGGLFPGHFSLSSVEQWPCLTWPLVPNGRGHPGSEVVLGEDCSLLPGCYRPTLKHSEASWHQDTESHSQEGSGAQKLPRGDGSWGH